MSLLRSMKHSFLSFAISVWLSCIATISFEFSMLMLFAFPDRMSNIQIIFELVVSMIPIISELIEIEFLFKNSTLKPYDFGEEMSLPS